jgi:hypothetical protein
MPIGLLDDLRDRRRIGPGGDANPRLIHVPSSFRCNSSAGSPAIPLRVPLQFRCAPPRGISRLESLNFKQLRSPDHPRNDAGAGISKKFRCNSGKPAAQLG